LSWRLPSAVRRTRSTTRARGYQKKLLARDVADATFQLTAMAWGMVH
jgi:hypothetical protein